MLHNKSIPPCSVNRSIKLKSDKPQTELQRWWLDVRCPEWSRPTWVSGKTLHSGFTWVFRYNDLMFVQSPLPFSIPLACVVFVAHWVNKDHFHLSHEEGNGWINDGSEAMTVNLHAQNQNSFAEMWHHSCFLYCRLAAELKTHMGKIWPVGWIEMVRRPVPDILKGKLNDTQKSLQAAAWCACGAATLSKFINDTKYSLTRSRGANIGFHVTKLDVRGRHHLGLGFAKMEHWLSSCCRFWLEESSISQWTTVQWVSQQLNSSVSQ